MKKTNLTKNKGITLIALVITIIVLLIVATVSIAMLTGENGILKQANKAKAETEIAEAKERAQMDIIAWQAKQMEKNQNSDLDDEIIRNILNEAKEKGHGDYIGKTTNSSFTTSKGNYEIPYSELYQAIKEEEKKPLDSVTGEETTNTTVADSLGNQVIIPAGFKVINPEKNVTDGIVIQDVRHGFTAGSEFVWIPVGEVIKEDKTKVTIPLGRYVFKEDGSVDLSLSKTEPEGQLKTNETTSFYFIEGLKDSATTNTHAKDIQDFIKKAGKGYYIGRYEARTPSERKNMLDKPEQLTVKPDQFVYNYIRQPQAAELSRKMYENEPFTSDLMNSYAWDTAIVFLQTFDNRSEEKKGKPYSMQNSYNTILAKQGTNNVQESNQDKICNIWDMASNLWEWSTETASKDSDHFVIRGCDFYYRDYFTSRRYANSGGDNYDHCGFRVILYL